MKSSNAPGLSKLPIEKVNNAVRKELRNTNIAAKVPATCMSNISRL